MANQPDDDRPHLSASISGQEEGEGDRPSQRKEVIDTSDGRACARHQMMQFGLFLRTIGLARAKAKLTLANLAYNFDRLIFHERGTAMRWICAKYRKSARISNIRAQKRGSISRRWPDHQEQLETCPVLANLQSQAGIYVAKKLITSFLTHNEFCSKFLDSTITFIFLTELS